MTREEMREAALQIVVKQQQCSSAEFMERGLTIEDLIRPKKGNYHVKGKRMSSTTTCSTSTSTILKDLHLELGMDPTEDCTDSSASSTDEPHIITPAEKQEPKEQQQEQIEQQKRPQHRHSLEPRPHLETPQDRQAYKKKCCWRWTACLIVFLVVCAAIVAAIWFSQPQINRWSVLPLYTQDAILWNSTSPQALAWNHLQQHPHYRSMPDWRILQIMALLTVYYANTPPSHSATVTALPSPILDPNECDWFGKNWNRCNSQGQLEKFSLYRRNLHGQLPRELFLLTALTSLTVSENRFTGTISTELATLTDLRELGWNDNSFTGTIPTQLSLLTNLTYLALHDNQLSGTIPSQLGALTRLTSLELQENSHLTGSIPAQLAQCTDLKNLMLQGTSLQGTIPAGICTVIDFSDMFPEQGLVDWSSVTVDCYHVKCSCRQCNCAS